ncbi:hypothetical protein PG993_006862 [Apiospora rasikravindrae]|uniref:Cellobiose dehydrogenase-like cytochrome domain-containing protein n=1 Tax=Apiospora rasikravindrae TaxID=990691 RepID=A0ABR1SX71_9PEZI
MKLSLTALLASAASSSVIMATQYCDPATSVCYEQMVEANMGVAYRIAIPNVAAAPFDILLQIVAPKSVGWAGVGWGGQMTLNPLTLGWANGDATGVSSRWAPYHSMPGPYAGATYTVLKGSETNSTHWTLTTLCRGCSQWTAQGGGTTSLDPAATTPVNLAYALSRMMPAEPANNTSSIAYHTARGMLTLDMAAAKTDKFEEYVQSLS